MSKTTENYGLTKPEVGEFFSLETWNENMDKIDGELKKREDAQKESDNSLMNPKFTEAKERKNLTSGEKIHLMLGKISKFFSDMKAIAFSGSYNDLVDKPKIPTVLNNQTTTEEGYALDARQANPNIDGTLAKQVADLNGSLIHYVVGECDVNCETYDNTMKAYVGGTTVDYLSNFISGSIIVPLEGSARDYVVGVVEVSIHGGNWIRIQSNVATVAHVRCLMLYLIR